MLAPEVEWWGQPHTNHEHWKRGGSKLPDSVHENTTCPVKCESDKQWCGPEVCPLQYFRHIYMNMSFVISLKFKFN